MNILLLSGISMKNKWVKFNTAHSPVKAATVFNGSNTNAELDLIRLCSGNSKVNGFPLKELASPYLTPMTDNHGNVNYLFKEPRGEMYTKLLCDIFLKNIPNEQKTKAAEFLKKNFHQGGLMNPVSAPLQTLSSNIQFGGKPEINLNFEITNSGFKVQEFFSAPQVMVSPSCSDNFRTMVGDNDFLDSEKPDTPVIQAQAMIEINFSNVNKPQIIVESNNINYANPIIEQELLSTRSLITRIIDFFKNLFGPAEVDVIDISTKNFPQTSQEPPENEVAKLGM